MTGKARKPGGKSGITRHKAERDQVEERLQTVEECLARGWVPARIHRAYGDSWNVGRASVQGYVTTVRDRQRTAAMAHTPDAQERREQLRQICYEGIAQGFAKEKAVVLTTKEGFSATDRIVMVPDPDLSGVAKFVAELAKLDGLYDQPDPETGAFAERLVVVLSEGYGIDKSRLTGLEQRVIDVLPNEASKGAGG